MIGFSSEVSVRILQLLAEFKDKVESLVCCCNSLQITTIKGKCAIVGCTKVANSPQRAETRVIELIIENYIGAVNFLEDLITRHLISFNYRQQLAEHQFSFRDESPCSQSTSKIHAKILKNSKSSAYSKNLLRVKVAFPTSFIKRTNGRSRKLEVRETRELTGKRKDV